VLVETPTADHLYRHMAFKVLASNLKPDAELGQVMSMLCGHTKGLRKMLREPQGNRTDTKTWSMFGHQTEYDLREGFPLLQSKSLHLKSIVGELLWMLSGSTNNKPLQVSTSIDQIDDLLRNLVRYSEDRGHIVSAWNVGELDDMHLRPCHCFFQCHVDGPYLDLKLYQRSADLFLGVPFNIASYALLLSMLAQQADLVPRKFIHTFGNLHIYENHLPQMIEQISRVSELDKEPVKLRLNRTGSIDDYRLEDVKFDNYDPMPAIKAKVAK